MSIVNPKTGRTVKIGSATYLKLIEEGLIEEEKQRDDDILEKSFENTEIRRVVDTCVYASVGLEKQRTIVLAEIPNKKTLLKYARNSIDKKRLMSCDNQAFFRSTGTSNYWSFESIFFPFKRVDSSGWIHKDMGGDLSPWFKILIEHFRETHPDLFKKGRPILEHFISKFGDWWQVKMSAGLGGKLWDEVPELSFVKFFMLNHDWNSVKELYIKSEIVVRYVYDERDCLMIDKDDVNDWLRKNSAICGKDEDSTIPHDKKTPKKYKQLV